VRSVPEIVAVVKELLSQGIRREEIRNRLIQAGEDEVLVDEALKRARQPSAWKRYRPLKRLDDGRIEVEDGEIQDIIRQFRSRPVEEIAQRHGRTVNAVYKAVERLRAVPVSLSRKLRHSLQRCPKCGSKTKLYLLRDRGILEVWLGRCTRKECRTRADQGGKAHGIVHYHVIARERLSLSLKGRQEQNSGLGNTDAV